MRKRFALLGDPVDGSLSPVFQNAAFRAAGVDAEYVAMKVDEAGLSEALEEIRRGRLAGANITTPHKRAAFMLCHSGLLSETALKVGAVNWLGLRDGRLEGHNTDVEGLRRALALAGIRPHTVAILGAGGAAMAAREALSEVPSECCALDRARPFGRARERAERADLVVSAVPALAWPAISPLSMKRGGFLQDLSYLPGQVTPAVAWARERGIACADGLRMLLEQGALSFERWLRVSFPRDEAERALGLR